MVLTKECKTCGGLFKTYPSLSRVQTCSISCGRRLVWTRKEYRDKMSRTLSESRRGKPTPMAGLPAWNKGKKTGLVPRSAFKKGNIPWDAGKKLGWIPKMAFKRGEERITGKNNHLWKGGITPVNHAVRWSSKMKDWREAVFSRDDYTCQGCDTRGGVLHPHHIWGFAEHPEYRFEVWNGQTLCKPCHIHLHKELGF